MKILEHDPPPLLGLIEDGALGTLFLTLPHRYVDEAAIGRRDIIVGCNFFDVGGWVDAWEQDKEGGCRFGSLLEHLKYVEGRLFDILFSHLLANKLRECGTDSIRPKRAKQ